MNNKCAECGKGGAAQNGICFGCMNKAISGKTMKSSIGKIVQKRFNSQLGHDGAANEVR